MICPAVHQKVACPSLHASSELLLLRWCPASFSPRCLDIFPPGHLAPRSHSDSSTPQLESLSPSVGIAALEQKSLNIASRTTLWRLGARSIMVQPAHTAHACRYCRQKRSKVGMPSAVTHRSSQPILRLSPNITLISFPSFHRSPRLSLNPSFTSVWLTFPSAPVRWKEPLR